MRQTRCLILASVQMPFYPRSGVLRAKSGLGRSTWQMAAVQAVAPAMGDRAAAKMWEAQLGDGPAPGDAGGNLFDVDNADPGIDGPFSDRVKPTRNEFLSSRTRDGVVGILGVLAAIGVLSLATPLAFATRFGRTSRK